MSALKDQLAHLKRMLRRGGATRDDAEDLVQEAVLRLCAYSRAGNEVRDTQSFLKRTVMNLAVDAYRSSRSSRFEPDSVENLGLIDLSPAPDEVCAAQQRLDKMWAALDQVSSRTREVFFMHRLQGL